MVSTPKPKQPEVIIPQKDTNEEIVEREAALRADALTEKLLKDEEKLNYDLLHKNLLSSHARSKSKKHVLDEFKLMDEKIKVMNDIAGEIGNDYLKYNKMVDTIQDFNKILDMAHDYPIGSKEVPRMEEIVEMEKEEEKKKKFYTKKEADEKINDAISKPPVQQKQQQQQIKEDDEEDLSELRPDEEERVKKILDIVDNVPVPVSAKKSPLVPRKQIEQQKLKRIEAAAAAAKQKRDAISSSKSPIRRDLKPNTIQSSPRLNVTYKVPTSNLVQIEKEMAEKREQMHQQFMETRAYEAQMLVKDIMIDSIKMENRGEFDLKSKKEKKIDLMTKTIIQLQKEEKIKRAEMQQRVQTDPKEREPTTQVKTLKSFTHFVHLQEPEKLSHTIMNPPMTYSQRLKLQQEHSIKKPSVDEIYKIYGTKRVPGVYKPYIKQTPRKVKTYQERVRELRPTISGTIYVNEKRKVFKSNKPLQKSKTSRKKDRFTPYTSPYIDLNEYPDEISPWSLDDKMKNILYDIPAPIKKHIKKQVKEDEEETLADTDDYLQMFYDEEMIRGDKEKESVHIDDFSLSTAESVSYVDWDQVDRILRD